MIYFTLRSDEWILVLLRLSFFETISHLSEIFLPNMSFILSLCILFVLFRLFLCISLNTDLGWFFFFWWSLHFLKICLNSNSAFQSQTLHNLLSFTNFLCTPEFFVQLLHNIRSALWRALYNISYQFYNKLLTSFMSKIL